jgi:hypothetical protein
MGKACSTNGDKRNAYRHTITCTFSLPKFKLMLKRTRSDNSIKIKQCCRVQNKTSTSNSRINRLNVLGHNGREQQEATKYIYRRKKKKSHPKIF